MLEPWTDFFIYTWKHNWVFNSWYLLLIYFDLFIILLNGMNDIKIWFAFHPAF